LLEQGGDSLLDHELIEYPLALAIPRKDSMSLAKQLLGRYGGLSALLTADAENIALQLGLDETGTAALKIFDIAAMRLLSEPVCVQPALASWHALLDYLRADVVHVTVERVRTLYRNSKNMLIRSKMAR